MRIVCRHALLGEAAILCGRSLTAGGRDYNIIRSVVLNIQYLWFRPALHFVTLFGSAPQIRTAFCHDPVSNLSNQRMNIMHVGQRQRSASGVSLQILEIQRAHSESYKRRFSPNYSMMQSNEILFWKQSIAKMITIHIILPFHNHVALRRAPVSTCQYLHANATYRHWFISCSGDREASHSRPNNCISSLNVFPNNGFRGRHLANGPWFSST